MKNKILVISGAQNTGKSFLIERIIDKEKTLFFNGRDNSIMKHPFLFNEFCQEKTQYVVFDNVEDIEILDWIIYTVSSGRILIDRQGLKPFIANTGGVLFIVETSLMIDQIKKNSRPSFLKRTDIVELASCSIK